MKLTLAKLAGTAHFLVLMALQWKLQQRLAWLQLKLGVVAIWKMTNDVRSRPDAGTH